MEQFPLPLLESIRSVVDIDVDAFLLSQQSTRRYAVRSHPRKFSSFSLARHLPLDRPIAWAGDGAYWLTSPVDFRKDAVWHAGAYYVQEASSMFLRHVLGSLDLPTEQRYFLDACASPGGKTTILYDAMRPQDVMIANESTATRQSALIQNLTKWGMNNVVVTQLFAEQMVTSFAETFDLVLADVPCSGSGLFRKKKSHQAAWTESLVFQSAQRQKQITQKLSHLVKEGGYLVYATCSYSPEENEAIIDHLLGTGIWESVYVSLPNEWGILHTHSPLYKGRGYRFFPHLSHGEGFYMSVLRKVRATSTMDTPTRHPNHRKSKATPPTFSPITKQVKAVMDDALPLSWLSASESIYMQGEKIWMGSNLFFSFLEQHASHLNFTHISGQLGKIKGSIFTPSHTLALLPMSNELSSHHVDLSAEEALRFISAADIVQQIAPDDALGKWRLAHTMGVCLGWIKRTTDGMSKNYFPVSWVET